MTTVYIKERSHKLVSKAICPRKNYHLCLTENRNIFWYIINYHRNTLHVWIRKRKKVSSWNTSCKSIWLDISSCEITILNYPKGILTSFYWIWTWNRVTFVGLNKICLSTIYFFGNNFPKMFFLKRALKAIYISEKCFSYTTSKKSFFSPKFFC